MTLTVGGLTRTTSLPDIQNKESTTPLRKTHSYPNIHPAPPVYGIIKTDTAQIPVHSRFLSERTFQTTQSESHLRRFHTYPNVHAGKVESAVNEIDRSGRSSIKSDSRAETASLCIDNKPVIDPQDLSQSTTSMDTVTLLLESLTANKECEKQILSADDVLLIFGKRVFRHGASGTALADSLNYLNHPYYAGIFILLMSLVGCVDAAYKVGEKDRKGDSCLLAISQRLYQKLHNIHGMIPNSSLSAFKKFYYNCSLIAAASTVPADLIAHINHAAFLNTGKDFFPPIICPLTIFLPTVCTAILTSKDLKQSSLDRENLTLDAGKATRLILQRVAIHATAGTISADIFGYLGHPEMGIAAILIMGSIGFIDGLHQCAELLDKDEAASPLGMGFQRFCAAVHYLYHQLEVRIPTRLHELMGKSYLYASVAGAAGTILADVFSYFGISSPSVSARICPITVALLTSLGALTSIVTGVSHRAVNPDNEQRHFLLQDRPVQIV